MPSHIISSTWTREGGGESLTDSVTIETEGEANLDIDNHASGTDIVYAFPIDVSEVESFVVYSDQDATIETNSGSTPAHTITVKANKPLVWYLNCGLASPFAGNSNDVVNLYITCAATFNMQIRMLVDSTP